MMTFDFAKLGIEVSNQLARIWWSELVTGAWSGGCLGLHAEEASAVGIETMLPIDATVDQGIRYMDRVSDMADINVPTALKVDLATILISVSANSKKQGWRTPNKALAYSASQLVGLCQV